MVKKITKYFGEVQVELAKVSWPSREELYGSSAVVLVLCLLLSAFIFLVDTFLNYLLDLVF